MREVGGVDALPPSSRAGLTRQERTVEVAVAADATDDLVDLHIAHASVVMEVGVELFPHLVEREQGVVRPEEPFRDTEPEGLAAHAQEVAVCGVRDLHLDRSYGRRIR